MIRQKDLIHSLFKEEEFVMVVLDACRYDAFSKYWSLSDVEKVWSSGSDTPSWLANTFTEKYDVIYFSANPFCSNVPNPCGWRGTDHFRKIIPVWDFGWKKVGECYTVPPEEVFKAYEEYGGQKVVLHLMVPHTPFAYSKKQLPIPWLADLEKKGVVRPGDVERSKALYPYWVEKYGAETVRRCYYEQAEYVVKFVEKAISKLSGKVVITADHRELLGEQGLWGHPSNVISPELRVVPWAEVEL
jgi:hypothetical protein